MVTGVSLTTGLDLVPINVFSSWRGSTLRDSG